MNYPLQSKKDLHLISPFHQLIAISTFYGELIHPSFPCAKKIQIQYVSSNKLCKTLLYIKATRKMLVKFTPVVNFTNILRAAYAPIPCANKLQTHTVSAEKLMLNTFVQKSCL